GGKGGGGASGGCGLRTRPAACRLPRGQVIEPLDYVRAWNGGEGGAPTPSRRPLAVVVLRAPPHRQILGCPGLQEQPLQFMHSSSVVCLGGSVNPPLKLKDRHL